MPLTSPESVRSTINRRKALSRFDPANDLHARMQSSSRRTDSADGLSVARSGEPGVAVAIERFYSNLARLAWRTEGNEVLITVTYSHKNIDLSYIYQGVTDEPKE